MCSGRDKIVSFVLSANFYAILKQISVFRNDIRDREYFREIRERLNLELVSVVSVYFELSGLSENSGCFY